MRIDLTTASQLREAGKATGSNPAAAQASSSDGILGTDKAQLSGDRGRVQALNAQVNGLPEIRQAKVEALGRAIRNGSYHVSSEQTAEALMAEMQSRFRAA
jgi:flagellar biosynthesis anti-sigma factor FlgM